MENILQIVFVVGVLAVFVWMLASKSASNSGAHSTGDHFIDPADSRQLATLIGMAGGNIKDAAVVKLAVERFRQQNGRLPTTREIGTLIGIMRSMS